MSEVRLSSEAMQQLEERLSALEMTGVQAEKSESGELSMGGCKSSTCFAWD